MNKKGGIKLPPLEKLQALGKQEKIFENTTVDNAREQVLELVRTVKTRLAPSSIHGIGVVALRDMKVGEQAYITLTQKPIWYNVSLANLKKHLSDNPEILGLILDRWPNVVNGQPFLSPNYDARLTSFLNHSDTPNYSQLSDCVLRDVKAGEELFDDYRTMPNYEKAFPWLPVV